MPRVKATFEVDFADAVKVEDLNLEAMATELAELLECELFDGFVAENTTVEVI